MFAQFESEQNEIDLQFTNRHLSVLELAKLVWPHFPKGVRKEGFARATTIELCSQISSEEKKRLLQWSIDQEMASKSIAHASSHDLTSNDSSSTVEVKLLFSHISLFIFFRMLCLNKQQLLPYKIWALATLHPVAAQITVVQMKLTLQTTHLLTKLLGKENLSHLHLRKVAQKKVRKEKTKNPLLSKVSFQ